MYLFVSRLTAQLPQFFSWRPDPLALATNPLLQDWSILQAYANPPWNLMGRTLAKVQRDTEELMLLIAPVWPSQPWYPILTGSPNRLSETNHTTGKPAAGDCRVNTPRTDPPASRVAYHRDLRQKAFQKELQNSNSYWCHGELYHQRPMTPYSKNGLANRIQIPFLVL